MRRRPPPSATWVTTRGFGWDDGCDANTQAVATSGCGGGTPGTDGSRKKTGPRSSTPQRSRSSAIDTGAARSPAPGRGQGQPPSRYSYHSDARTRGEPDGVRVARPVRAGGLGKRTGGDADTAPQADPTGWGAWAASRSPA